MNCLVDCTFSSKLLLQGCFLSPPMNTTHNLFPSKPFNPSLPHYRPKFLLNPSLKNRCFRSFERCHFATRCREPRRYLLLMRFGHLAKSCRQRPTSHYPNTQPEALAGRLRPIAAFLPYRAPSAGLPQLSRCIAVVESIGLQPDNVFDCLSQGLAGRFGGSSFNYKVAIGRSSLRFGDYSFRFLNW